MVSNNREYRKQELESEISELLEVKHLIEGDIFQKYFALPLKKKIKESKNAYSCQNMYELKYNHGLYDGLSSFFSITAEIDNRIKFRNHELKHL